MIPEDVSFEPLPHHGRPGEWVLAAKVVGLSRFLQFCGGMTEGPVPAKPKHEGHAPYPVRPDDVAPPHSPLWN